MNLGTILLIPAAAQRPAGVASGGSAAPGTAAAGPAATTRIEGIIAAAHATGRLQLRTRAGVFSLSSRTNLPVGSRVTLEVRPQGGQLVGKIIAIERRGSETPLGTRRILPDLLPADALGRGSTPSQGASATAVAGQPTLSLALARNWPNLDLALELIGKLDPGMAKQIIQTLLPNVQGRLAAALLAFFGAVRNGNIEALLGRDGNRILDRAKDKRLRADLGRDLTSLRKMAEERGNGPWRALFIPLVDDTEVNQVRFFVRRKQDEAPDGGPAHDDNTRFVVEADLSMIGPLQLDGFVAPKRLDLIVRSRSPLPEDWRNDIRSIFDEAAQLSGVAGAVAFQAMPVFPVLPLEEDLVAGGGGWFA